MHHVSQVASPMPLLAFQMLEKKIERRIRLLERKSGLRFLDEVRVHPVLDREAAVDRRGHALGQAAGARHGALRRSRCAGPVIELGPGTGAVTEALVEHGIEPSRLVLVEFNPSFCRLLRTRYPEATVIQGDAYRIQHLLGGLLKRTGRGGGVGPAADDQAVQACACGWSTRPSADGAGRAVRAVHLRDGAADPEACPTSRAHASELIWQNLPPARVWVYRKG